jgi:Protein of unknown function (DUF1592)/Protein of unknown function (DUF1588)/Protein of unknown function (DUF1587)/Protein of unknown function (DUF1585)/Protein of unknown function (DUF1595)
MLQNSPRKRRDQSLPIGVPFCVDESFALVCSRTFGVIVQALRKLTVLVCLCFVAEASAEDWGDNWLPLMKQYCIDCHNADNREGDVDLSVLQTREGFQSNVELTSYAVRMIRFGSMPPEDADVPDDVTRKSLADSIDDLAYQTTCDLRPHPGKVTARRLNRAEYNNAIRDLFGIDMHPADDFPSDEVGAGFDNNADVLSVSPMLIEKYLQAAEKIAAAVIVDPEGLPNVEQEFSGSTLFIAGEHREGRFGELYLEPESMVQVQVTVPVGGDYSISWQAAPSLPQDPKHSDWSASEDRRESLEDDREFKVATALVDESGVLKWVFKNRFSGGTSRADHEAATLRLDAGTHRLRFFPTLQLASTIESSDADRWKVGESNWSPSVQKWKDLPYTDKQSHGDKLNPGTEIPLDQFSYKVARVNVSGPRADRRDDLPATQRQILRWLAHKSGDRWKDVHEAAITNLTPLIRRAFRTEVTREDVEPYANLVVEATNRGDSFYAAMRTGIASFLVSPRFLFRVETPDPEMVKLAKDKSKDPSTVPLSSTQMASRLSFFLWSSLPDEELLKLAKSDRLRDPKAATSQVIRMLRDDRSKSLSDQFATQWLGLGNLLGRPAGDVSIPSPESMAEETMRFFNHLLQENRPVSEFLTADYTFVDKSLANFYGIDGVQSNDFEKVSLAGHSRRGLLGHASVLTLTSYPTRNSPVQRGKWILENILGTPPPEAPPGVPALEETKMADANATLREQLELHRADPGCASCHRVMDALGFGLEEFDYVGRLREANDPAVADATGELPGGGKFRGAMELSSMLANTQSRQFAETVTRRLLAFAIGRELRPADRCFIEAILDANEKDGYRLADLVNSVATCPPMMSFNVESTETK